MRSTKGKASIWNSSKFVPDKAMVYYKLAGTDGEGRRPELVSMIVELVFIVHMSRNLFFVTSVHKLFSHVS